MPSRFSPFAQELEAQGDSAQIKLLWGEIARKGYGTNAVRAQLKDLIAERDVQGLPESDRKALAQKIITACDQVIQAEQRPQVEDRRADWLARGMVTTTTPNHPDVAGRYTVTREFPDGYTEVEHFAEEEFGQHIKDEIHTEAQLEDERRELKIAKVPDELKPLIGDVDALFAHMHEQREGESVRQRVERVQGDLALVRPAMNRRDYERLSALASEQALLSM
jgi:hypothetical protein